MNENIRPDYYSPESPYEPLKVIHAWGLGFCLGNALKYIARAGKKGGEAQHLEDLKKARTYLDWEIARLSESVSVPPAQEKPVGFILMSPYRASSAEDCFWQQGRAAYYNQSEVPYEQGKLAHAIWVEGYKAAQEYEEGTRPVIEEGGTA